MKKKNKVGIILFIHEESDINQEFEAKRFSQEIRATGLKPQIFYIDLFSLFFKKKQLEIFYNNKELNLSEFKFFIPRYSLFGDEAYNKFSLVRALQKKGVKVFNTPQAAFLAKDKRDSLLKLALAGLAIVPTGINYSSFFLDEQLRRNPGKIVAKANAGSLGYGVSVFDSHISFISFMEFLCGAGIDASKICIQPYINAHAEDYRLYVVGDKVVAGMKRKANGIDFRANISKGGLGEKIKITKEMSDLAIKANKVLGLDFAGVDIIKDENGNLMLLEVNCNAQFKIEGITKNNVVGKIVRYCIKKSK